MADFAKYYYYQNEPLPIIVNANKTAVYCKSAKVALKLNSTFKKNPPATSWYFGAKERIFVVDSPYAEVQSYIGKVIKLEQAFIYPVSRYENEKWNAYNDMVFNGQFLVRFREGLAPKQVSEICTGLRCRPVRLLKGENAPYLVQYDGEETAFLHIVNAFREKFDKELVVYAHPNFVNAVRQEALPGIPGTQTDVFNQIRVSDAWQKLSDRNFSFGGVKVAVLDEGIHDTHTDIALTHRFDQVGGTCPFNYLNTHGTSVAGIIGAKNNLSMLLGVAFQAQLADIRISYLDGNKNRQSSTYKVLDGLQAAIDCSAKVINISWTQHPVDAIRDKILLALNKKITVCCAVGNFLNGESAVVRFPASLASSLSIIAVGACNDTNILISPANASFGSCFGPELTITAPGLNIPALTMSPVGLPGVTQTFSGTSAATALVSGAAALLLTAAPGLTPVQVRDLLRSRATNPGTVLNAGAALAQVLP